MNDKKEQSDGKGYSTDIHEIIQREMNASMKPFVQVMMESHEEIRNGQREQNEFLKKSVDHDTWIKTIGATQVVMAIGFFLHWLTGR